MFGDVGCACAEASGGVKSVRDGANEHVHFGRLGKYEYELHVYVCKQNNEIRTGTL